MTRRSFDLGVSMPQPGPKGLRRKGWWEPFSWERAGIGMSVPFNEDLAEPSGFAGQVIRSVQILGLQAKDALFPLRVCIRVGRASLAVDRAIHPAKLTVHDAKRIERPRQVAGIPFLVLTRGRTPRRYSLRAPAGSGLRLVRRSISRFKGQRVTHVRVRGNRTLAVGPLVSEMLLIADRHDVLRIRITTVPATILKTRFHARLPGNSALTTLVAQTRVLVDV